MVLERIGFDKIAWEKPGVLYRGTFQGRFEHSILKLIVKHKRPLYCAVDAPSIGEHSFCSPSIEDAMFYVMYREVEYRDYQKGQLFSHFPLLMAIRTERYKNRLHRPREEGVVISGPIEAEDITVLYSSHIDELDQESRKVARPRGEFNQATKSEKFSRTDLLSVIEEDPKTAVEKLCQYAFGFRMAMAADSAFSETERDVVIGYIEILKKMLRRDQTKA